MLLERLARFRSRPKTCIPKTKFNSSSRFLLVSEDKCKEDQASFYAHDTPLSLQNKVLSQIALWALVLHSSLLALNPNHKGFLKWLCILEEALVFNLLCLCPLTEVKNDSFQNIGPGPLDGPRATGRKEVIGGGYSNFPLFHIMSTLFCVLGEQLIFRI